MKKTRILALVIAVLSLVTLLFLVSCKDDSGKSGNCAETGDHKWTDWKSKGDATCTEDGTRYRRCPICKAEETDTDAGTATGHYFLESNYIRNDDATCTEDGTETAVCYLCEIEKHTRPAENSALGHRFGNNPVAEESFNGYNVFVCLREGCGHKETFDNGTIDEDFEHTGDVIEDNSKRYFAPGSVTELVSYAEGEGKYLMLKRSSEKIIGSTAFGIFFTPDYDIYKAKDYIISYDLLITENTRDLVLLEGKKMATKQVFASYDSENGTIVSNGKVVYTVTKGEWINLAFVLDDVNGEFDLYANKSLVVSKGIYDKKDDEMGTYALASTLEYLGVYMVAEPKAASEFGIDNVKTAVGKAIEDPAEPLVKENITTTLAVPHNIMGDIDNAWFEKYQKDNNLSNDQMSKSFGFSQVEKDGKAVNTVVWQNYSSGVNSFTLKTFAGMEKYTTKDNFGADVQVYDLSEYNSVTFTFYCDTTDNMPDGYTILVALYSPEANENGAKKGSYFQKYYTFTAEDVLNGEDGWKTVTIPFSELGTSRGPSIKKITQFVFHASGWAPTVANNGVAVDGTVVKLQSVSFNKPETVTYAKLDEGCEHEFSESRNVPATCLMPGFDVKICSKCHGEQPDETSFTKAIGHNYETIQDIPATCLDNGYYSEKCLNCNDKIRVERVATGHTESTAEGYAPVVIAPTCYSTGITVRTCGACGETYETDPTEIIEHTWDEGVTTTEPTCTEEGVTTYTCIHNGENGCDGTKTEPIAALGHTPDMENAGAYVPATCDKGGYTPTKCAVCQVGLEIANEEDPKLGHDWEQDLEAEGNKAPTCFGEGVAVWFCKREGCTVTENRTIPATGQHNVDYNASEITKAPTCTEKGVKSFKCTNEGCTYVETAEVDVIPHTESTAEGYAPVVTAPVCGVDGYTTRKCSVCGQDYKTDIVEAEEHDDGGVEHIKQTADCVNDGWEKYTCVKCGVEVTVGEVIPSKGGHKYEIVIDDEMKKLVKHCTVCDEKIVATTDKIPTYTELVDALKADGKIYTAAPITQAVGSTSTGEVIMGTSGSHLQVVQRGGTKVVFGDNKGVDGVDKYFEWHMKPAKTGDHAYINAYTDNKIGQGGKYVFQISIRLGTPGSDGKWGGSNWQFIDRSSAAVSAGGNQFVDFATVTDAGVFYILSNDKITVALSQEKFTKIELAMDVANNTLDLYVDGILVNTGIKIFNDTNAAKYDMSKFEVEELRFLQYNANKDTGLGSVLEVANVAIYGAERPYAIRGIDYCGLKGAEHNYVAGEPVAPDCFNDGYTPYTCEFCGDVQNRDTVAKLEHVEVEVSEEYAPVVTAPTCFSTGYTKRLCKNCNEWYVTDETEMIAHTMGAEPAEKVEATCITPGYDVFACTVEGCGHTEKKEYEAKGHSAEATEVRVVAPTCTDGGYTVMHCPDCDTNYKTNELPANGHAFGDFVRVIDPTCTEKGKETRSCANCIWTESKDVAALGHTWVLDEENELTFDATCYADGSKFSACSVCGETKVEAITARPAHTWGEYEVETPATCTEVGKEVRTCTVEECGATSDRTIAKLGHKLDEGTVTTAPTCTEDGIRTKACTREGCDYTEDVVEPKLGHDIVIDPENNTYSCTEDGNLAYKCARGCGYSEVTPMKATGHKFQPDEGESAWEIITPATCYSEGLRTRPCLNFGCDAKSHEAGDDAEKANCIIRMIDHNVDKDTILTVEPTTEAEGYTYNKCVNEGCTHIVKLEIIPAITTGTQGFVFDKVEGGYYITGYTGTDKEIIIPATYKGEPVVGIDSTIFAYDAIGITGVTIESADIFASGDYGIFAGCNLTYVVVKAGITVPMGCFDGAVIGTIYLEDGASIEDIDWGMFEVGNVVNGPKE